MDFFNGISHRLPLHFSQRRQEKLFYEKLELLETTDQGDNQFVFQGQCMVLGNSGVGKTSLVTHWSQVTHWRVI